MEIQIRTALQHHWAELSEKLSDLVDPAIKYGGGSAELRTALLGSSALIASIEDVERRVAELETRATEEARDFQVEIVAIRHELKTAEITAHAALDQLFADIRTLAGGD